MDHRRSAERSPGDEDRNPLERVDHHLALVEVRDREGLGGLCARDAEDQAERFEEQMVSKNAGDDEAMPFDKDYLRALEYGLPPTAGLGVGIDRSIMLFADVASIRDVLLFPHMRPEAE